METDYEQPYGTSVRPNPSVGVGRGQAARLSAVWVPYVHAYRAARAQVLMVIFDIRGKPLAEKALTLKPGRAAYVDFMPASSRRAQVWGYLFIDGFAEHPEYYAGLAGGIEVIDTSSGQTRLMIPVGNG